MMPELTPPPSRACPPGSVSLRCRPAHVRRLTVASLLFALAVAAIVWAVGAFILEDLSESYVSRIITQAKDEAEAFARVASDPALAGEGETREAARGRREGAIDPDVLLDGRLDRPSPQSSQPDAQAGPRPAAPSLEVPAAAPPSLPDGGRVPAVMETSGKERQLFLNGELIERRALQIVKIRYPTGERVHRIDTLDRRSFDRALLPRDADVQEIVVEHPPSSRAVLISWNTQIDGQNVELETAVDASVIDEGVAELRRRIVPKVVAGGALFIVLLGVAYAFVFRLLGEARRLEAEANQQAMLAQVGMLAAGLAHEIRNPLSAVNMNLQLLEEDLEEPSAASPAAGIGEERSSEHLSLLRAAQREIRRLSGLVSDFLAYARPAEPRPAPHSLDEIVRDCVGLFRANAEDQGVELGTRLEAGEAPVLVDEALIKQAVMNVVVNAIQAVPKPGGRVTVSTERTSEAVRIRVEDDGPGLPADPEVLFRVFHSTRKGGSGLGLPISRAIVERHGGRLEAGSVPGGGAAFTIVLPIGPAA